MKWLKEHLGEVFVVSLVVSMIYYYDGDRFWSKQILASFVSSLIMCIFIVRKYNVLVALSFVYTLMLGIFTSLYPFYTNLAPQFDTNIRYQAMQGTLWFLTLTVPFIFLNKDKRKYIEFGLFLSAILNIVWIIVEFCFTEKKVGLFDGNTSINGCMLAFTTPFFLKYVNKLKNDFKYLFYALPIVACFITRESVPVIAVMLVYLIYAYMWFRKEAGVFGALGKIGIICFMLFFCAYQIQGDSIFRDRGRFTIYKIMNKWMEQDKDRVYYFGTGTGSFHYIGPKIQQATGFGIKRVYYDKAGNKIPDNNSKESAVKVMIEGLYVFMHCDWLQAKFEQGWSGLLLFIATAISTVLTGFKNGRQSSTIAFIALLFVCCFNYPLRIGAGALMALSVLFLCFNQEDERKEVNHAM